MFRKNTSVLEVLNKFNSLENKIDTLNTKFETLTLLDGCCDCKKRETKIYTDLVEYLEVKFSKFKESILEILDQNSQSNENNQIDRVEELYIKHVSELNMIVQKCCQDHTTNRNDMYKSFNTLESKIFVLSDLLNKKDFSLRTDLQTFLVGLQNNIETVVKSETQKVQESFENSHKTTNNTVYDNITNIESSITELTSLTNNINTNVKAFYFENELVKNQILIEEEIRMYSDEIDHIRLLATQTKELVENTLKTLSNKINV